MPHFEPHFGTGRLTVEDFSQPEVNPDYFGGTAGAYAGFEHFGRVVQQLWRYYGGTPAHYFRRQDSQPASQPLPILVPNPTPFAPLPGSVGTGQDHSQQRSTRNTEIPASRQGANQRGALVKPLLACRLLHIRRRSLLH